MIVFSNRVTKATEKVSVCACGSPFLGPRLTFDGVDNIHNDILLLYSQRQPRPADSMSKMRQTVSVPFIKD